MKAWRWHCTTHDLDLLTLQTGTNPPTTCNAFADIVWPDDGPCFFQGSPVLSILGGVRHSTQLPFASQPVQAETGETQRQRTPPPFPNPGLPDPQSPGWERRAGQRRGTPLPPSAPARHNSRIG